MQLLVHITNHPECVNPLLAKLMDEGISGATVIDCKGMLESLSESNEEPPPIFGSLRQFINPDHAPGKIILILLKDEDVNTVREAVHSVSGNLKKANTGIMFTLPVMGWEGVSHK